MPAHKRGEEGYHENRYIEKIKYAFDLDEIDEMIDKVRTKPRGKGEQPWLGVDPLRDKSLLAVLWWLGLRSAEIVGDRPRKYKVSRFSKAEQTAYRMQNINWTDLENPYIQRESPERPGIHKDDMKIQGNNLLIIANPLKHGERAAPFELPISLAHVNFIVEQWKRTKPKHKVWDIKREYTWAIMKELGAYPHHFRFSRATALVRNPKINPLHLKNWMGWKRLETAYNYMEKGGRYQKETGDLLVEQYKKEKKHE